jgi:hypothetical protein
MEGSQVAEALQRFEYRVIDQHRCSEPVGTGYHPVADGLDPSL